MQQFMPLPKYHQVYLVLKERLLEGFYDKTFPGEVDLTDEFSVSRVTIRKALGNLASEGLIERTAGRGTRRVEAKTSASHQGSQTHRPHLLDNLVAMSQGTTVKVLEYERIPATDSVASALQIKNGADVLRIVRVRSTKEGPVSYIAAWLPVLSSLGLTKQKLARKPILNLIEEAGIQITNAVQNVSARQADSVVARHLGVPVGSALLAVNRIVFDSKDRPVQWLQGLYRPDRYQYEMKLSRSGETDAAKIWIGKELTTRIQ